MDNTNVYTSLFPCIPYPNLRGKFIHTKKVFLGGVIYLRLSYYLYSIQDEREKTCRALVGGRGGGEGEREGGGTGPSITQPLQANTSLTGRTTLSTNRTLHFPPICTTEHTRTHNKYTRCSVTWWTLGDSLSYTSSTVCDSLSALFQ